MIKRADLRSKGIYYRAQIGPISAERALGCARQGLRFPSATAPVSRTTKKSLIRKGFEKARAPDYTFAAMIGR